MGFRDKRYIAPAKICGDHLGMPELWCDWGLKDHHLLQRSIGGWTGWCEPLVDWVVEQAQHYDPKSTFIASAEADLSAPYLRENARYHFALGILSQFRIQDIAYFLRYETVDRPEVDSYRYNRLQGRMPPGTMQWVPCPATMSLIEAKIGIVHEKEPLPKWLRQNSGGVPA